MRNLILPILLAATSLALVACAGSSHSPGVSVLGDVRIDAPLRLASDDQVIEVHLLEVMPDPNCLPNAECAPEGRALIRLRVDILESRLTGPLSEEIAINLVPGQTPAHQSVRNVSVSLYNVTPGPSADQAIAQSEFSVRMRIREITG